MERRRVRRWWVEEREERVGWRVESWEEREVEVEVRVERVEWEVVRVEVRAAE